MNTTASVPHSIEAERAVLGAVLAYPELFFEVAWLPSRDFFRDGHQTLFAACEQLASANKPIDPLMVKMFLEERKQLERVGGAVYLFGLPDGVPRSTNVVAYAQIVADFAERRRLMATARRILANASDLSIKNPALFETAERGIAAAARQRRGGDFVTAAALVTNGLPRIEQLLKTRRGVTGVPTGFIHFDTMTRGLQPGSLALLAARPSMGKTAFALNVAYHAASHGHVVGFFSLEMCESEVFIRLVSAVGGLDGHRLQAGYASPADYDRMSVAFSEIAASALYVDDSHDLSALELRSKARRLKAQHGLGLIVVDYLQLMRLPKAENRNIAVAEVSRSLKLLARELEVPVLALSQLSRRSEQRSEKKPMLSDLRDSGALEQDADLVVFIHREEVCQPTPASRGFAEIFIGKQRNGPTGTIRLRWCGRSTRFDNMEAVRA
jgi:replicative DNA helicase